jgi:hypothetical protein
VPEFEFGFGGDEKEHRRRIEERLDRFISAVEDATAAIVSGSQVLGETQMSIDALTASIAAQTTAVSALTAAVAGAGTAGAGITQASVDTAQAGVDSNTAAIAAATAALAPTTGTTTPPAFVQGTNPDGTPMVDANGNPVDQNGNPKP